MKVKKAPEIIFQSLVHGGYRRVMKAGKKRPQGVATVNVEDGSREVGSMF